MDNIFTAIEEEIEKLGLDVGMDDLLFEMTEAFLEEAEPERAWTYTERIGKHEFQAHGRVTEGEGKEESCVYVDWIKIGRKTFQIGQYL